MLQTNAQSLSIHITELLSIRRTDHIFIYNCYQYEIKMYHLSLVNVHNKCVTYMLICHELIKRIFCQKREIKIFSTK